MRKFFLSNGQFQKNATPIGCNHLPFLLHPIGMTTTLSVLICHSTLHNFLKLLKTASVGFENKQGWGFSRVGMQSLCAP